MRSYLTRTKHWLLLSISLILVLAAAPLSRAQSEDQDPNQVQAQEPYQDQQLDPNQVQADDRDRIHGEAPLVGQASPSGDSHARIVRISYVDGQVRLDRGQGYESATMNVPITERNWLQTRSDGWAEVQMEDGSVIRLSPDTVIAFTELGRSSSGATITTIDLDQGEAEFKVAKHGDSEFQVTVKNKTIMLDRSGSFRVTSVNADPMEVVVWKGEVAVRDSDSGEDVAVKKNETFVLDATDLGRYALDKAVEADALDQWSKERDDYLSTYAARGGNLQSPYQYGAGDLNYYGQYFDDPGYGTLWQPSGVNIGWDPFMNGYWAYSPGFGYTWVSAYPWGWMPYRYGRWVYLNNRGWCWAPGGWNNGWHTGPRWANAPPGFHPPVPPTERRIVISGAPGGRVVIPGTRNDRGGPGRLGSGGGGERPGRLANGDDHDRQGARDNGRRVFTNDDVQSRVPRTDVPAERSVSPGEVDANRPATAGQHALRSGGSGTPQSRFDGGERNSSAPATGGRAVNAAPPAERTRILNAPRMPQPVVSQPTRSYTPPPQAPQPARQYVAPPAPAPMHQSAPAPAPMRSYSPPAETHSAPSNDGARGGRVR
ncbi:MAG: DUF6600 domain-containing protein [Candidatus Angelobacter sp.]